MESGWPVESVIKQIDELLPPSDHLREKFIDCLGIKTNYVVDKLKKKEIPLALVLFYEKMADVDVWKVLEKIKDEKDLMHIKDKLLTEQEWLTPSKFEEKCKQMGIN